MQRIKVKDLETDSIHDLITYDLDNKLVILKSIKCGFTRQDMDKVEFIVEDVVNGIDQAALESFLKYEIFRVWSNIVHKLSIKWFYVIMFAIMFIPMSIGMAVSFKYNIVLGVFISTLGFIIALISSLLIQIKTDKTT